MRPRVMGADPLASGPFSILGIRCGVAMSPWTRPSEQQRLRRRRDPAPASVSHPLQMCAHKSASKTTPLFVFPPENKSGQYPTFLST